MKNSRSGSHLMLLQQLRKITQLQGTQEASDSLDYQQEGGGSSDEQSADDNLLFQDNPHRSAKEGVGSSEEQSSDMFSQPIHLSSAKEGAGASEEQSADENLLFPQLNRQPIHLRSMNQGFCEWSGNTGENLLFSGHNRQIQDVNLLFRDRNGENLLDDQQNGDLVDNPRNRDDNRYTGGKSSLDFRKNEQERALQQNVQQGHFGRDDWSENATLVLLEAWREKCEKLNKWHLRRQQWVEVAEVVTSRSNCPKTDVQCKNRVDTLKKKYKQEKQKLATSGGLSKWPLYAILDRLVNADNNASTSKGNNNSKAIVMHTDEQNHHNTQVLLPCTADAGNIVEVWKSKGCSSSSSQDEGISFEEADECNDNVVKDKSAKKRKTPCSNLETNGDLMGAIGKLGEIFERMEEGRRQQLEDLERIRREYARDLEMHRMQLMIQTQIELSKLNKH